MVENVILILFFRDFVKDELVFFDSSGQVDVLKDSLTILGGLDPGSLGFR